jgi:cytochrome P450
MPASTYNLKKDFKTYGNVYKHTVGTQTIYFLSNPEDFKKILVTDWKKFGKPPSITKNLMWEKKRSLFTSEPDDQWKRQRSLASPAFSDNSLQFEFETNIDKVTNDLIKYWDKKSLENGEIDASNDFGLLTLDAIGISGFGQEFKAVENQDTTFSDIIDMIFSSARYKNLFPPFIQKLPIPLFQNIRKNEATWKKYIGDIVDKRREELEKSDKEGYAFDKTDLLSKMMNSHIPDENPLEQEELYTNVHTFIAAGHETTANTLRFNHLFNISVGHFIFWLNTQNIKKWFVLLY